ncbi:hypothetical protein [Pseudoalteromonas piratica]|uniref:hypothetical protein n=1 Tax=Pseudoalteromonas piratica TaxID=1348114 RepID=UPI000ADC7FB8|nr:hypothetical protein [Pseudoalteromonas piratica]
MSLTCWLAWSLTVLLWAYVPLLENGETLSVYFYELLPGFVASSIAIVLNTQQPDQQAMKWFNATHNKLQEA